MFACRFWLLISNGGNDGTLFYTAKRSIRDWITCWEDSYMFKVRNAECAINIHVGQHSELSMLVCMKICQ